MLLVVYGISLLVHIYGLWYLGQDPHLVLFLRALGRFTRSIRILVTAPNLLQLFLGWEGVGLCSFVLISFWWARREAPRRGFKRILYNRIGDVFFLLRIACFWLEEHTLDIATLSRLSRGNGWGMCFLVRRRFAKSAQFPFHRWLADAIEGPTPVSALLHAATMVVAGVFLLLRIRSISWSDRTFLIGEFGRLTCLRRALLGRRRNDLKAVIAYSTCSQLGYIVVGVGATLPGNSLRHLVFHARFKRALFLRAGSVLHRNQNEQNLRSVGGIGRSRPRERLFFWVRSRSLIGFPYLSGFCSKDSLLEARRDSNWLLLVGLFCLGGTAFYRSKRVTNVFSGPIQTHTKHVIQQEFVYLSFAARPHSIVKTPKAESIRAVSVKKKASFSLKGSKGNVSMFVTMPFPKKKADRFVAACKAKGEIVVDYYVRSRLRGRFLKIVHCLYILRPIVLTVGLKQKSKWIPVVGLSTSPLRVQLVLRLLCRRSILQGVFFGEVPFHRDLWVSSQRTSLGNGRRTSRILLFLWTFLWGVLGMRTRYNWWVLVWLHFEVALSYRKVILRFLWDYARNRIRRYGRYLPRWDIFIRRLDKGILYWCVKKLNVTRFLPLRSFQTLGEGFFLLLVGVSLSIVCRSLF